MPISQPRIKEIKSNHKIRAVKKDQVVEAWRCKKCGSNSYIVMSATHHKFGGAGISPTMIKICRNCGLAEEKEIEKESAAFEGLP